MTTARGSGPVVVAVVGAGKISEQYLTNMRAYPDLDVRFVADLVPSRARDVAETYGVTRAGSVAEALADDEVEIVVNLTIPAAHAEVAAAALTAGKHVWNEKPITLDRATGQALLAQADAAGLRVGCAPDTFLGPGWQSARRLLERGDIGEPLTASVVFQTPGPHTWHPSPEFLFQAGGGPLLDMAPYYLTALIQVFGSITSAAARGGTSTPMRTIGEGPRAGEVFDVTVATYVTAIYDFESGAIAAATFSFDSPLDRVGVVEIAGTTATLAASDPNQFGGNLRLITTGASAWTSIPVTGIKGGRGTGVVDLARAIRSGEPHRASGRLGVHVLDAMLATADSIERSVFAPVTSRVERAPLLPEGWDPYERTL